MPHKDPEAARTYFREYKRRHRGSVAQQVAPGETRTYGMPQVDELHLSGEELLVVAFLRLKVADARRHGLKRALNGMQPGAPEQARAFLRDREAVSWWAELLGTDGAMVQKRLLQEAGMESLSNRS